MDTSALDNLERREAKRRAARLQRLIDRHDVDQHGVHYSPSSAAYEYREAIKREIRRALKRAE